MKSREKMGLCRKAGSAPAPIARLRLVVACGLLLLDSQAAPARGAALQEQGEPRISLSPAAGLPETSVTIPIYFWAGSGVTVASLSMEIQFPEKLVSFVAAERSFISELSNVDLRSEVGTEAGPESSILKLTLSTHAPENARDFIPEGPVASVTFRIAKDAPLSAEILLQGTASGMSGDNPSRPVESIAVTGGRILVEAVPLTACFFYMH
ncbi:MAG: hypothetical protein HYX74_10895 [Acidobacteria bacterium]|nr:hypothetical protein [Acidobacteriota bacterium]